MRYFDDITTMNGGDAEAVDVVIGGSPCQGLSVAGQRKGLGDERSVLFLDQIRVIKEMHSKYDRTKPRYMVFENVPGALSSTDGEDFRRVLEETVRIVDETAVIPRPEKGKWTTAGAIMGDDYSVAWRVLNAQFFGVPQRRRRLTLIASFTGQSAPEILFKSESVSGDTAESGGARKATAADTESDTGETGEGNYTDRADAVIYNSSSHGGYTQGAGTLRAAGGDLGGGSEMLVIKKDEEHNAGTQNKILRLLQSTYGTQALVEWETAIMEALQRAEVLQQGMQDICDERQAEKRNELDDGSLPRAELVAGWLLRDMWLLQKHRCSSQRREPTEQRHIELAETLPKLPLESSQNPQLLFDMWKKGERLWLLRETLSEIQETRKSLCSVQKRNYNLVRRLTPLEAERLQGYPDGWTDIGEWTDSKGKKHKTTDTARYKALGNSIALPPWRFVCRRISEQYDRPPTMGSLFDGIGGFPLIWREINGADSVPWVCEIDEYCKAVTRRRFT